MSDERKILFGIIASLLVGLLMGTLIATVVLVPAGSVSVVTRWGAVTSRTLRPGLSLIIPFVEGKVTLSTQETVYETSPADKMEAGKSAADYQDYDVDTNTSDGQHVDVSYSVKYSIQADKVGWIVQNIGDQRDVNEKVVKFHSRILARLVPRRFTASTLYMGDGQEKAQDEIAERLTAEFGPKGVILLEFGIRELVFEDKYMDAIESKQIEREKITAEEYKAEQAFWRKEATITIAQGEAEAYRVKAEAIAESPEIVQLKLVEALEGQNFDVIFLPSEMLPLINIK